MLEQYLRQKSEKKNIRNNRPGLAFINKLNPITYNIDLNAADKIAQGPALKTKDGRTPALDREHITGCT